ncbi:hypothetical protein, partial [Delftia acidovorans]|uniref:hypothetical protein n=1 Tax=Delftia acidovorans TaxID=80866 RepID=UPI001C84B8DD
LASLQSNFFDLFNTSDLHRFSSAEPCIVARFLTFLQNPGSFTFQTFACHRVQGRNSSTNPGG